MLNFGKVKKALIILFLVLNVFQFVSQISEGFEFRIKSGFYWRIGEYSHLPCKLP